MTPAEVAAKHPGISPHTIQSHLQALKEHFEKVELIEKEQKIHKLHKGDEVLVNRIIDGTFMNIGEVQDVQPGNQITIKFMGNTETLNCEDLATIPQHTRSTTALKGV